MGYSNKTITLEFPELGDDIQVVIRNPLFMPDDPDAWAALSNEERARQRFTWMVVSWTLFDLDTDELLALPKPDDTSPLEKAPRVVMRRLAEEMLRPLAPPPPPTNGDQTADLPALSTVAQS